MLDEPPSDDEDTTDPAECRPVTHHYQRNGDESPSEAVIAAVSVVTDTSPLDLEALYHRIDPDALDALFDFDGCGGPPRALQVRFRYDGCSVVVTTSEVRVESTDR